MLSFSSSSASLLVNRNSSVNRNPKISSNSNTHPPATLRPRHSRGRRRDGLWHGETTTTITTATTTTTGDISSADGRDVKVYNILLVLGSIYVMILFFHLAIPTNTADTTTTTKTTTTTSIWNLVMHTPGTGKIHDKTVAHEHLKSFLDGPDAMRRAAESNSVVSDETSDVHRRDDRHDPIVALLNEAGIIGNLTDAQWEQLPTWDHVVQMYGSHIVVNGLDRCNTYRETVPVSKRVVGVAGLFNTGTNLLEKHLHHNLIGIKSLWQVPWGKHRMAAVRWNHTANRALEHIDKSQVLPIVMVRDPFAWFQSMCSHPYSAKWRHGSHHCPNFVPNEQDRLHFHKLRETFRAIIKFDKANEEDFDSMVDMWNVWYQQYLQADYPVLMIRFEDLVFQPRAVLQAIANCVEAHVPESIYFQVASSKAHGSGTDFIKAIIKTADSGALLYNMTAADLDFTRHHLDQQLLSVFHYSIPAEAAEELVRLD